MRAVSITNRGGRRNNEDSVRFAHADGMWCFALCDGLGGHRCGEIASAAVAETICAEFENAPSVSADALRGYIEKAAQCLEEERMNDIEKYDMSSTAVVLVTDGEKAVWAHAGDSRLYYIRGGKIEKITNDHSIAFWEYQNGLIGYDDIRSSPNQNKLLRCISDTDRLEAEYSEECALTEKEAFLLCSDGFWEFVRETDIENSLDNAKSPKEWLENMLTVLHENETENNDNYSAIAVMI
ncbi:MAG: serine/threonine-protein phosphatase [Clostridia bacterium]|nr:serine/threonine-protein phosphatase [Clostridia bacterium]